jgi:hypothetical protein
LTASPARVTFPAFIEIDSGMATVEHSIPIPVLYEDILTLYEKSGSAYTPTHLVNYGGTMGEQLLWGRKELNLDEKYLPLFASH